MKDLLILENNISRCFHLFPQEVIVSTIFVLLNCLSDRACLPFSLCFKHTAGRKQEKSRAAVMMTSSNTPQHSADTPSAHCRQVSNTTQHQHQPPCTHSLSLSITNTRTNVISPTALLNPAAESVNCSRGNRHKQSHTEREREVKRTE